MFARVHTVPRQHKNITVVSAKMKETRVCDSCHNNLVLCYVNTLIWLKRYECLVFTTAPSHSLPAAVCWRVRQILWHSGWGSCVILQGELSEQSAVPHTDLSTCTSYQGHIWKMFPKGK